MQQSAVARPRELQLNPDLAWLVAGEPRETVRDCPIYLPWQSFSLPKAFKLAPKVPRTEPRRYFARYSDGCHPVEDFGTKVKVHWPTGPVEYGSQRAALAALTGHPSARNWTWDRYFRLGKRQTPSARSFELLQVTIFDVCRHFEDKLTTAEGSFLIQSGPKLGIDLNAKHKDVRKLLAAGFGATIHRNGWDFEDVLAEVYKGILVRNSGKCPWDSKKSSLGHWVHMVCGCIVKNYYRKSMRQHSVEPIANEGDELAIENTPGAKGADTDEAVSEDLIAYLSQGSGNQSQTKQLLSLVQAGYTRAEIAEKLCLPKPAVSKMLAELRGGTRRWMQHGDAACRGSEPAAP